MDVLEGIKVKGLQFEEGRVVGVYSENKNFRAKIVVGADGANGVTAKALGIETLDENHNAVAIRSYYSNIKGMTIVLSCIFLTKYNPDIFGSFLPIKRQEKRMSV